MRVPGPDRHRRVAFAEGAAFALIFAAALFLRLRYLQFLGDPGPLEGDARNYDAMVRRLLAGRGYGYWPEGPDAYVTPGFPLFLALIYRLAGGPEVAAALTGPLPAVRLVHAVLGAATAVLAGVLARQIGGRWAGWVAGALVALYPPFVWSTASILTEVLGLFTLLCALVAHQAFWDRPAPGRGALAGALLGLAVLVRPQFALLLLVLPLSRLVAGRWGARAAPGPAASLRPYGWFVLGFVAAMLPWWVRNAVTLGRVVLLATQAANPVLGGVDPYFRNPGIFAGIPRDKQLEAAIRLAIQGLRTEPLLYIKWFTAGKLSYTFGEPYFGGVPNRGFIQALAAPLHWAILGLGVPGVVAARALHRAQPVAASAVALTVAQLVFIPQYRYAYPIMALLAVLAGVVVARAARRLVRGEVR